MLKAVVINGSPRMAKGNTGLLLSAFTAGMEAAGAEVELVYPTKLKVKPCSCGQMVCWYETPGECCIKDSMQQLYPILREAEHLVLATPVYIPLPGDMQNVVNRLCPLVLPRLAFIDARTRAEFRQDVAITTISLVATSGWWEVGNMDTVLRIAEELALDAGVNFGGALLRPHASVMRGAEGLTPQGNVVMEAARKAGYELVTEGAMQQATLDAASQPLIAEEDFRRINNRDILD